MPQMWPTQNFEVAPPAVWSLDRTSNITSLRRLRWVRQRGGRALAQSNVVATSARGHVRLMAWPCDCDFVRRRCELHWLMRAITAADHYDATQLVAWKSCV